MRGIFRVERPRPLEDEIRVEDGSGQGRFMLVSDYRAAGYRPPVYSLPTADEYKAQKHKDGGVPG